MDLLESEPMSTTEPVTRRSILAGALASPFLPAAAELHGSKRGLAPARDFMLKPGIVYLQTGSAGATPRPVMEAAFETWRDIELNPTAKCYFVYEERMDAVREETPASGSFCASVL